MYVCVCVYVLAYIHTYVAQHIYLHRAHSLPLCAVDRQSAHMNLTVYRTSLSRVHFQKSAGYDVPIGKLQFYWSQKT